MRASLAIGVALGVLSMSKCGAANYTNTVASIRESPAQAMNPAITQGVTRLDYTSRVDGLKDWALAWPPVTGRTWAVVLHGHGSHGDQLYTRADIREHWLQPLRAAGLGILTANLRDNAWMCPSAADDLHDLVGWVRQRYGADRFVFVSGSMGGFGNLAYAMLHPEDCAAVAALGASTDLAAYYTWCKGHTAGIQPQVGDAIATAYGGTPDQVPELYRRHSPLFHPERFTMPLFLAHGEKDPLMPVAQAREFAAKLKGQPDFIYEEVPGGGHDSPLFLKRPMDWLIQHATASKP
jgi:pimeloyl-ACP methyl ester carboxylesterase